MKAEGFCFLFVSLMRFCVKNGTMNLSELAWLHVRSSAETLEMSVFRTPAGG